MTLAHRLRRSIQRLGLDVQRYPQSDPLWRLVLLLRHCQVEAVLDVGANVGEFASEIRRLGYGGGLVSFEPVPDAFRQLRARAHRDSKWEVWPYAVGDADGRVAIHVAGNAAASSSVLAMLDEHQRAQPDSRTVDVVEVPQRALDSILDTPATSGRDRLFLKVDVQGYEAAVLEGAAELLASERLVGLQIELSFVPLYAGAPHWQDLLSTMTSSGFDVGGLIPGFSNANSGRMYQADVIFVRRGAISDVSTTR